jgi:hypothetical protein
VPIGFGEDDVQRDGCCTQFAKASDEATDEVTTPGPLTERRQAALVDIHNHDGSMRRSRSPRAEHRIVDAAIRAHENRRSIERENGRDDCGKQAPDNDASATREECVVSGLHAGDDLPAIRCGDKPALARSSAGTGRGYANPSRPGSVHGADYGCRVE